MTPVNIVPAESTAECYRVLTGIWRRSVEATHHFLTIADIDYYAPKVEFDYLPAMQIRMAMVDSTTAGFSGIDGDRLEMLFVDDRFRGKGVGSALLEDALARTKALGLDVNEQNPDAADFYRRKGFVVTGRSALDSDGRPFPLLHMMFSPEVRTDRSPELS